MGGRWINRLSSSVFVNGIELGSKSHSGHAAP